MGRDTDGAQYHAGEMSVIIPYIADEDARAAIKWYSAVFHAVVEADPVPRDPFGHRWMLNQASEGSL